MSPKAPHFSVVAPIFPVTDMETSLHYYREALFFKVGFTWPPTPEGAAAIAKEYAIVQKEDTELHLTLCPPPKMSKARAYFFLTGIDAYYEAVTQSHHQIPEQISQGLATQPWGMREFEVIDPDGHVLIFGAHISDA